MIAKGTRGVYHKTNVLIETGYPARFDVNIDGSAREHTKTHTCQTEADRAGAIYFVRRKFCFL